MFFASDRWFHTFFASGSAIFCSQKMQPTSYLWQLGWLFCLHFNTFHSWLVVSNMFFCPFHIWDVILPIDSYFSSWLWKTTLNRIESMRLVRKEEWLIFQRDSRYIYFEEQVVMSKESTKCRNAQQELNFCHERRQKTFPEHPESDGWAMQRVAPPQETHTMVVGNMQQHFSPKNGWCSTSRSTAAFGLVMTKISGASRNQRNLLILISHSLGLLPVYKWL